MQSTPSGHLVLDLLFEAFQLFSLTVLLFIIYSLDFSYKYRVNEQAKEQTNQKITSTHLRNSLLPSVYTTGGR